MSDQLVLEYKEIKINIGLEKMRKELVESKINQAVNFHLNNATSSSFHIYYLKIQKNKKFFLESNNFFSEFKSKYSLQGIDNKCLDQFESNKKLILDLIDENKLMILYMNHFVAREIKSKEKIVNKDLDSFYSKFLHTFIPEKYPALDNPIKKYLGFKKDSFLFSFFCISELYSLFIETNPKLMKQIRNAFIEQDKLNTFNSNTLTDIKLLDLILWKFANVED